MLLTGINNLRYIFCGMKKILIAFFALLMTVSILVVFVLKSKKEMRAKNMNLLFITIDTCRADHIGAYGSQTAQTPILDNLALHGIVFENCYTPVPLTLPSHCSIFTGRYPLGHNVRNNGTYFLNPNQVTLAEKIKERGYQTFAVVASFVLLSKFGLNRGFDFYDDTLDTHRIYNNFNSEIIASEVYEKFRRWFGKNYQQKFFIWLHFYDPHAPYTPPEDFAAKFKNDAEGLYDGEIAFVDFTIGKVIKDLEEKAILGKTVIVICGDHGEAFGEHQEFEHGIFCYQEALKVPLIFYNENLFAKVRSIRQRVNLTDILPTLFDLYAIEIPKSVQGKSMVNLLNDGREKTERTFYIESMYGKEEMNWAPLTGVISGRYKYISLPQPEMYDIENDGGEKNNLYSEKNDLARKLDRVLMRLIADYSESGVNARRELTPEDREHLRALGYISSFSTKSSETIDPKKGIVLDNEIKACLREVENEKIDQAELRLKKFLNQNPSIKLPAFYDVEYLIRTKRNQTMEAVEVLKKAITDFPWVDRFYILYALNVFKKMNRDDEAEIACRELLKVNPMFASAYILLGEICEKRKDIMGAISNLRKALEIEPQNISLKIKYAELLIFQKDYAAALTAYNELLENEDVMQNSELLFKIALFNTKYGTWERAEELLQQVIQLEPKGKYFFNYALVLAKNQKIEEALRNMETALSKYANELSAEQRSIAQKAIQLWK